MAVIVRVRTLTKKPQRLEAIAKGIVPRVLDEMDMHCTEVAQYLRVPHHKPDSKYIPTFRYTDSVEEVDAHETKAELVAGISVDARDDRGHNYTVYVGGDETGEGQQTGWVGPWPIIADSVRGGGSTGIPEWRQRIRKVIKGLVG